MAKLSYTEIVTTGGWHVAGRVKDDYCYVIRAGKNGNLLGGFGSPYPDHRTAQDEADRRNSGGHVQGEN